MIVSRETVRNWVTRFGSFFAACIKRDRPRPADKWHLDEVVVQICDETFMHEPTRFGYGEITE